MGGLKLIGRRRRAGGGFFELAEIGLPERGGGTDLRGLDADADDDNGWVASE